MSYKNKHIVNFGLSDKDYDLLIFLFRNSHCSSIAEFFRFVLREYFNLVLKNERDVKLDSLNDDIVSLRNLLLECFGVVNKE